MSQHNLPTLIDLVMLFGSAISIAGFFLFLKWKERNKRRGTREITKACKLHTRRKVKGRKRYH